MATVANEPAVAESCPACASKARRVAPLTVRSLVKPELADTVGEEIYRFCESPACDVVYFSEKDPLHQFVRSDLRVRVGQKETEPPIQVCYCFDWTTDDIERELHFTGTTTIPDRIKQKVQQGVCHCETMNPQGSCCLGHVNKAVREVRAKLASRPEAGAGQPQHHGQGAVVAPAPSVSARLSQPKEMGGFLATLGAVLTAIMGSACCWLPLLLIAFGFSAAGVGSFFEQYRPYLLTTTFALLGVAWYFTYRTAIRRAWVRLRGKATPMPAVEACCASENTPSTAHCCCGTEPEPEPDGCCAPGAKAAAGQATRRRLTMRQFNRVMLWMATVVILLFALFPHWIGLILGSGSGPLSESATADEQRRIVLKLDGLTCEGCAVTVQQALRKVPGVAHVQVNYARSEAVVQADECSALSPESLIQAIRDAGYEAKWKRK